MVTDVSSGGRSLRRAPRDLKIDPVTQINEFGQPVGAGLEAWTPPSAPEPLTITGSRVELVPMALPHAARLFEVFASEPDSLWTYMGIGPFATADELEAALGHMIELADWLPFTIMKDDRPVGFLSYLRIDPKGGVIEIGSIVFSSILQRTPAATEAIYLLLLHAFDLGYRRVEWKCDDLNEPSRRAATRLGFTYEGTFQQATHYKGRNRDTAWYSIIDRDWPPIRLAFESWLDRGNFEPDGNQRRSLSALMANRNGSENDSR
jgi:RimJ/RimL family protein N-acetyltransferase